MESQWTFCIRNFYCNWFQGSVLKTVFSSVVNGMSNWAGIVAWQIVAWDQWRLSPDSNPAQADGISTLLWRMLSENWGGMVTRFGKQGHRINGPDLMMIAPLFSIKL
jgi:hypothetical protein